MPGLKDRLTDAGYGLGWSVVCRLPAAPRFGVIPLAGIEDRVAAVLPAGSLVTVTCSPRQELLRSAALVQPLNVLIWRSFAGTAGRTGRRIRAGSTHVGCRHERHVCGG